MMDLDSQSLNGLDRLLTLLRAKGVRKFKGLELDIDFEAAPLSPQAMIDVPLPPNMPADLRNPELMTEDQIRNWSASPDDTAATAPIQGTGDIPLGNEP